MYRQINVAALPLADGETAKLFAVGQEDVEQAFQYYLDHYNNGRPFILAAHSQGSYRVAEMAKKIWGNAKIHDQMVAAYIIGWSLTPDDLKANPAIRICENATQTGCFITYNSVAEGMQSQAPTLKPGTVAVNPLTWKTDGEAAPASLNIESVFFNHDGTMERYQHFASAQVKDSGLVVVAENPERIVSHSPTFPNGVYHVYDFPLFYGNLRANVAERIRAFLDAAK